MERIEVKNEISKAIREGKRTIILWAPGGYGKTYIANEYCEKSILDYPSLISGNGEVRKQLECIFEEVLPAFESYNHLQDSAFARLLYSQLDKIHNGDDQDWVITYDDVTLKKDDFISFVNEYMYVSRNPKGLVIITTQNCWGINNKYVHSIKVDSVDEETAKAYLFDTIPGVSADDVNSIIEATGRIALPLRMAGALIQNCAYRDGITISEAVADFCNGVALSDAEIPSDIQYNKNLYNATLVTVNNILRLEKDPESVYDLLMCSAITAANQFKRQTEYTKRLKISNWQNAFSALTGWRLFVEPNSYNMHPTTQDVLLDIDYNRNHEAYLERLCRSADAFLSLCDKVENKKDGCVKILQNTDSNQYSNEFETAKRMQMLLAEAVSKAELSKYYRKLCELQYSLSYGIAFYYYSHTNNYKDREYYYLCACDALNNMLKTCPDDLDLLYKKAAQNRYRGVALRALDRNDEAIICLNESLELYNRFGQDSDDSVWHEIAAEAYYNRGLVNSDKACSREVLKDYKTSEDVASTHYVYRSKAVAQRCLGIYYTNTGKYETAIRRYNESIKTENGENAARCLTCLGILYAMKGDWTESKDCCLCAIDKYESIGHRVSYKPLLVLERCYRMLGDKTSSKNCLIRACKAIFGESQASITTQIAEILNGKKEKIKLNGKDYNDIIAIMLLCIHCVEHLIETSDDMRDKRYLQPFVDMAFGVRGESFKTLRDKLFALQDKEFDSHEMFKRTVKGFASAITYNKRTCASLLFVCAKYYLHFGERKTSKIFAYAAFYLSDSYKYAFGRDTTKRFIQTNFNEVP